MALKETHDATRTTTVEKERSSPVITSTTTLRGVFFFWRWRRSEHG
jgi:hypothetical protein